MKKLSLIVFLPSLSLTIFCSLKVWALNLEPLKQLVQEKKTELALQAVNNSLEAQAKLSQEDRELLQFSKGILEYQNHQWKSAQQTLRPFASASSIFKPYANYHIAQSLVQQNELKSARSEFLSALKAEPSLSLKNQILFDLSEVEIKLKNWSEAHRHLYQLSRRWRNSDKEPLVLWRLLVVDLQIKGKKQRACQWAERLYAQYPAHPIIYDWSIDLHKAMVHGERLGCTASQRSTQSRIRRLQWAGEGVRARQEIDILRSRSTPDSNYVYDELFAEFQIQAGFVKEAVDILKPHYKSRKNDYDFLALMAKALSRSFHHIPAAGFYRQAAALDPKGPKGRKALFLEAFQSYQFQDYDSALIGFRNLIEKHSTSIQARDARWYVAWVHYLRGEFGLAEQAFDELSQLTKKSRVYSRAYPEDRLRFWSGMSAYRADEIRRAASQWLSLQKLYPTSYYTIAAQARMAKLNLTEKETRMIASELQRGGVLADVESSGGKEIIETEEFQGEENQDDQNVYSSETIEDEPAVEFSKPMLNRHHQLALSLARVGFFNWARDELYEIERRTKNRKELEHLIEVYAQVEGYRRSAYLSETFFQSKWGLPEDRSGFLTRAFPQAFKQSVESSSQSYGVEPETIWSIMRAESYYRPEISSPVGAVGLMQLMPYTAEQVAQLLGDRNFSAEQLTSPDLNIRYGTRYLQRLETRWNRKLPLVAASYNAGPHRVDLWLSQFGHLDMDEFIEHIPFSETRNYVKKVSRYYSIYQKLYQKKPEPVLAWLPEPVGVSPPDRLSTREAW